MGRHPRWPLGRLGVAVTRCLDCHRVIHQRRLDAIPDAKRCLRCQAVYDEPLVADECGGVMRARDVRHYHALPCREMEDTGWHGRECSHSYALHYSHVRRGHEAAAI